jgi:DnaJ domain
VGEKRIAWSHRSLTQDKASSTGNGSQAPYQKAASLSSDYYALLGLKPSASVREIRQAYRELSKLYHPDTTTLPSAIATAKFQRLNEAYATLSSADQRLAYDQKAGYSRVVVSQPLPNLSQPQPKSNSSAYIDATDRPLSPGEIFALFILGVTFVGCLVLAIAIGFTKGENAFEPITEKVDPVIEAILPKLVEPTPQLSMPAPSVEPTPEALAPTPSVSPSPSPSIDPAEKLP